MRFIATLFALFTALSAQTFRGNIAGTVQDASGAAIPNAAVKLESPSTGLTRAVMASASGDFTMAELPTGLYTIGVTHPGFESKKIDKIEVVVSKTTNLNITLGVASQASLIEVSAQAVTLETTSTALVGVVDTRTVKDLPLNGRDFRQMLKMAPGVNAANSSVNGMRTSGNNYQIDGADNNDAFHNTSAVNQGGVAGIAGTLLPVEAIDQFSIQTNAGADVGRNGGSSVNLVIKSGTNSLHGSAYYFNRNEALASPSPLQPEGQKARAIRNHQYGLSLGGPVIRNRTFFFVTGEGQDANAANSALATVPSDAWVADARTLMAQYGVPVNPLSLNMLTFWPARTKSAGAGANNFLNADSSTYNSYNGIIKVDHRFNANHSLSARYFGGTGAQTAPTGSQLKEYFQVAPSRMHNVSVVLNSVLTPRMVNQLTLGTNFFLQVFNDADTSIDPNALGLITGVTEPSLRGTPTTNITGFTQVGSTQPLGRIDTTGHLTDNLSYTFGKHQLKVGGEYRRALLDVFYDTNKRGTFTFDGARGPWASSTASGTLKAMADFLAGYTSNSSGAIIVRGQLQRDYTQNSFDSWVHDTWQLTPTLSLNYGVRFTYHGPLGDKKNSLATFVPGKGFVGPGSGLDTIYPRDLNNFMPRAGFAWTPKRNGKTVLRGSLGFFNDVPPLNFMVANTGMPNGGSAGVHANPGGPTPVYSIALSSVNLTAGTPIFGTASPRPPFGAFAISQDYRTPYVINMNFNVQQQLTAGTILQVGYVGSQGRKLSFLRNINAPIPGTTGTVQARRPYSAAYPDLAAINMLESNTNSNYNSMQVQLRQTMWKGVTGVLNYTWSKAIDYGSDVRNNLPTNSYDLRNEKGPSSFDTRHVLTAFLSYEVPAFVKAMPLLMKGWQFNSLFTAYGGQPLNILAGTNISTSGDSRDRANVVGDPFSGVVQPTGTRSVRYFNAAAFAAPAAGTFGNIGRNAIYGPGFGAIDFSIFKTTPITEKISTQFRVEIFNLTNRTNWANPGTSLASSSTFGLLTNTRNGSGAPGIGVGEPRNIQLALKVIF
ncbi:MAG: carboxypeptidase regulatory-like domain-containing protein [Acidobacteria bacterium]|nr:carboxypeptidase regulatory-like domain-containing protein [Acidobacteriota bacterium]